MNTAIRWIAATGILLAASAVRGVASERELNWQSTVIKIPRAERVPVKDLLQNIAAQAELRLAFDFDSITDANGALDTRIDANFQAISAGDALKLVLKSVELNYEVLGNTVLIKRSANDTPCKEIAYEVGDLIATYDRVEQKANEQKLIDLITSTIAAQTWAASGGPATISLEKGTSRLLISQSWSAHQEVGVLLRQLRELRLDLRRKVNLNFHEAPLAKVLANVSAQCGANIYLLPDCGSPLVSIDLKEATVAEALDAILKPLKLRQKLEHGALVITSDKKLFTVTYPVGDLVRGGEDNTPDFESLVRRVKANVLPDSWQKRLTEHASVEAFSTNLSLVVCQNEEGQELVQAYLKKLRAGN